LRSFLSATLFDFALNNPKGEYTLVLHWLLRRTQHPREGFPAALFPPTRPPKKTEQAKKRALASSASSSGLVPKRSRSGASSSSAAVAAAAVSSSDSKGEEERRRGERVETMKSKLTVGEYTFVNINQHVVDAPAAD
jgi:anti-sigma28 factor (negative regulator of flagellin synthesis)